MSALLSKGIAASRFLITQLSPLEMFYSATNAADVPAMEADSVATARYRPAGAAKWTVHSEEVWFASGTASQLNGNKHLAAI